MPSLSNQRHEMFALKVAAGMMATSAYKELYPDCSTENAVRAQSSKLLAHPNVAARVTEIRQELAARMTEEVFLTLEEKRRMLAQIARVDVVTLMDDAGNLDMQSLRQLPACVVQEVNITKKERTDKEGNTTVTTYTKLKLVDRLRAMEMDTDLTGDGPIEQPETTGEKIARAQRAKAMLRKLPGHGGHLLDGFIEGQSTTI